MEKRNKFFSLILCLILAIVLITPAAGFAAARPMESDTELVVVFSGEPAGGLSQAQQDLKLEERVKQTLEKRGLRTKKIVRERRVRKDSGAYFTVALSSRAERNNAIAALNVTEGVEFAEPLTYYYASGFNDPRAADQWALDVIDAYDVWQGAAASLPSVIIAILDSGVRLTHEDLAASIIPGYDFIDNDTTPTDLNGHGTHVAGIAAAVSNNAKGIASVAGGAKIMPVRVLDASGSGTSLQLANGITYAADNGADIINMSLGSDINSQMIENAVKYAQDKGCLIVAASGNDYDKNVVSYPAAIDGVIIAAALTENAEHIVIESDFSNYSAAYSSRTIHAPGDMILSTDFSGDSLYSEKRGTSMAASYISGMAAALLANGSSGSAAGLYDILLQEAVPIPRYYKSSAGIFADSLGADMKVLNDNGVMDTILAAIRRGDVNTDGIVNATDLSMLLSDFGKTSGLTNPNSDVNGDGKVDATDLSILISNFGS